MQLLTLVILLGCCIVFCWVAESRYWDGRDDALTNVKRALDRGMDATELKYLIIQEIDLRPPFLRLGSTRPRNAA